MAPVANCNASSCGNYDVAAVGRILQSGLRDDHLRRETSMSLDGGPEQNTAAQLPKTTASGGAIAGYQNATPPRAPALRPNVHLGPLMQAADDNGNDPNNTAVRSWLISIDDDITGLRHHGRATTAAMAGQGEPPLTTIPGGDATPASSQPEMSCRLTKPFEHPCDIPELIYDQDEDEDVLSNGPDPPSSGPATPSVVNEIFRPLADVLTSPNLALGPFTPVAPQGEMSSPEGLQMRKMSVRTMGSELTDGLGMIREEDDDDRNTDGVSMLSCTESSTDQYNRYGAGLRPLAPSISSSGSTASGEWRLGVIERDGRKSATGSLFSRMRGARNTIHEAPPLERRSLTPYELSAPAPRIDYDDHLAHDHMLPPPTPSSGRPATIQDEAFTAAPRSFGFGRLPWLTERQPKRPQGDVFGVDLSTSIKTAPMKIRISHRGKSTSYRTFPLCVYKASEFIRKACIADPTNGNVFLSPGYAFNVLQLKDMFNQPPMYGENFEFEQSSYTPYDAARLIILYLEELPKPLISSSVIRSWVQLARQEGAIEPPAFRVETGLDFWTEALNRLPTANRNLTKHLLSLFAEILVAKSGEVTELDARHLASAVSRAFFHQDAEPGIALGRATSVNGKSTESKKKPKKKSAHPTLALAFLIKKRGEYAITLQQATGMGNPKASKSATKFLPTTDEILAWKNTV